MTGPGDQEAVTAADRGYLRASDADRDQLIDVLTAALSQGRLTRDEFGTRMGQALASRTYADLAVVTAGIPARPAASPPRNPPGGKWATWPGGAHLGWLRPPFSPPPSRSSSCRATAGMPPWRS